MEKTWADCFIDCLEFWLKRLVKDEVFRRADLTHPQLTEVLGGHRVELIFFFWNPYRRYVRLEQHDLPGGQAIF